MGIRFAGHTPAIGSCARGLRLASLGLLTLAIASCSGGLGENGTDGTDPGSSPEQGFLEVSPTAELVSSGLVGGPFSPTSIDYVLSNSGGGDILWRIATAEPWVRIGTSGGVLEPGESGSSTISIDESIASTFPAGQYLADVFFTNLTSSGGNTTRTVVLTVFEASSPASLQVLPPEDLTSTGETGGPFAPSGKVYLMTNTGGQDLSWQATSSESWINLSRASGLLTGGGSDIVTVTIDAGQVGSFAPGTYSGTVTFVNQSNGTGDTQRTVTLDVTVPPAFLEVTPPTDLTSSGDVGGPFAPASRDYLLTNTGGEDLVWQVSASQSWVSLSETTGTIAAGGTASITVAIDALASSLSPGTYNADLFFSNATNGGGNTRRAVFLTVFSASAAASLQVTPPDDLTSSGGEGGPFTPDSRTYTLTNSGGEDLAWQASSSQPWATVSQGSGTLAPGAMAGVTVALHAGQAAALPPGLHAADVTFTNATNGDGSTSRTVILTVQAPSPLIVTPATGFTSSGPVGGPFSPGNRDYLLENPGADPLTWSAVSSQGWLSLSSTSGTLATGGTTTVNAAIDQGVAGSMGEGTYSATVTFLDETNGVNHVRDVTLTIFASGGGGSTRSSVNRFGITWTFDGSYETGQYANGDWWVVGPVNVVDINPPSTQSGGRTQNGSMVNPHASNRRQGYDSATYSQFAQASDYDPSLNVALGVSASNPLTLSTNTTLISTISVPQAGNKPQIDTAAILTVVTTPPPSGSFRPPYCGNDKTSRHNVASLDYSLLGRLPTVPSTPSLSSVENMFEGPWLEHVEDWLNGYIHPRQSMPHYGRDIAETVGTGALMLHLDFTNEQKETLLIRYVQLGIDLYGIVEAGGGNNWPDNGGHGSGRKWPILFAGLVLGDQGMSGIGFEPWVFGEDGQTFYVEETSPGVYNNGYGGYGPQHEGMAEWAPHHDRNPAHDSVGWFANNYRLCCTANVWWGQVLAVRIMGAQSLWNHDSLFDYQDRYYTECPIQGVTDWKYFRNGFHREMWETYRSSF